MNARASIDALKRCGCTDLLAISSVGSLREELEPGRFIIVDQFIDRTVQRPPSFFGTGMVAHGFAIAIVPAPAFAGPTTLEQTFTTGIANSWVKVERWRDTSSGFRWPLWSRPLGVAARDGNSHIEITTKIGKIAAISPAKSQSVSKLKVITTPACRIMPCHGQLCDFRHGPPI